MIIGRVRPRVSGSSPGFPRAGSRALPRQRQSRGSYLHGSWSLAIALPWLAAAIGCGLAPLPRDAQSFGSANDGVLLSATSLGTRGEGFVRANPGDETHYGTRRLVGLLTRAASAVSRTFPGTAPLYIGDLSARHGGKHVKHGSHRSGRDVDVLFYLNDAQGRSQRGSGFYAFDERGVAYVAEPGAPVTGLAFLDVARNWALVRAMLLDDQAPVQWIFCANGIKVRLLAYARAHETDPELLVRASYVLHQPTSGNPHRDHFHIRLACSAEERSLGCIETGPVWPWMRDEHEKPSWDGRGVDDATLLRALLDDSSGAVSLAGAARRSQ
jgi:penicillin-insensitive murein endopeptidase